jgi:hypothetical protein
MYPHSSPAPYTSPTSAPGQELAVMHSKSHEDTHEKGDTGAQKENVASSSTSEAPILEPDDIKAPGITRSRTERLKRLKPIPPTYVVVEPFGGLKSPSALTPVQQVHPKIETPTTSASTVNSEDELSKKPTCTLNLVCYSRGCAMSQIRVTMPAKFHHKEDFRTMMAKNPKLITSDEGLFQALRDKYLNEMCGFWRRCFSLKMLRCLRLLSVSIHPSLCVCPLLTSVQYTPDTRPTAVPLDEFTMQEVLYAYNHPSEFGTETDWIEWVFRLRQPDKRHALEFVEGWNGTRIAVLGSLPCIASTLVGVIWSARGGDIQTAFTVAGFILTVATGELYMATAKLLALIIVVLLALLAVISGIDSKSR